MTLEEALGKITDPEVKTFFTKMVADQNSYITKLETQLKELKERKPTETQATGGTDSITQQYVQRKMREDVIAEATKTIIENVGLEIYQSVKADYEAFLTANMKLQNTNLEYAIDAFNLVYGRCYAKKDHPVHQVGKAVNPNGTPTVDNAGTNGQQVAKVQNIISGQPPVMSGSDANANRTIPGTQGIKVVGTKDAFTRLKTRIKSNGGNQFQ